MEHCALAEVTWATPNNNRNPTSTQNFFITDDSIPKTIRPQRYQILANPLACLFRLHRPGRPLPLLFVEDHLPKADFFWCDFDTFILLDIFHTFFQRHLLFRNDPDRIIASTRPHIGQLLSFRRVDDQVPRLDMFGDDLTYVDIFTGIDKERAPILQLINRIGGCLFLVLGQQHAVIPAGDRALPGFVFQEPVRHDRLAGRIGQHIATQPDQPPRRDLELQVLHFALAFHYEHFTLPLRDHIDYLPAELSRYIDHQDLIRFTLLPVDLLHQYRRLSHRHLESFAAHRLDQDAQMKNTAPINQEAVRIVRILHPQRQVLFRFLHEAVTEMAGSDEFAILAVKWGVVDPKKHAHRRFIYADYRKGFRVLCIGNGISDIELLQAHHRTNIAGFHFACHFLPHTHEGV